MASDLLVGTNDPSADIFWLPNKCIDRDSQDWRTNPESKRILSLHASTYLRSLNGGKANPRKVKEAQGAFEAVLREETQAQPPSIGASSQNSPKGTSGGTTGW